MNMITKNGSRRAHRREGRPIELGPLETLTGYAIKQAQERVFDTFMAATPDPSITPARFAALTIISANDDLTQTDLAEILSIARSGAAAMLKALQDMGYVSQVASDGDRRAVRLQLTPAGRIALKAVTSAILVQDEALTSSLTEAERETLLALLKRICS